MKFITDTLIHNLVNTAKSGDRLRMNHNFHDQLDASVQRFCNAFEPGTYVRPHRHDRSNGWEFFIALKGRAVVLAFTEEGVVLERHELSAHGPVYGIEIPSNTWHAIASLESGTVLFEFKEGPYIPATDKNFANWAPMEGEAGVHDVVSWYESAKPGESFLR